MRAAQEWDDDGLARVYGRMDVPWLRANFVAGVDGAVAVDGLSAGLSGAEDRRLLKLLRMLCDGLLVGATTLRAEGYRALTLDAERRTWRVAHGLDPYPRLVVVSGSLDLDPRSPALAAAPIRPLVLTCPTSSPTLGGIAAADAAATAGATASRGAARQDAGSPGGTAPAAVRARRGWRARRDALAEVADVLTVPDLRAGLALLREQGLNQLLCEGGPTLLGSLTGADLVDELCLTVSPLLAAAGAGRIVAGTPHPPRTLALAHSHTDLEGFLYLRYTRP